MNVYTYYAPVPQLPMEGELALIDLWRENWFLAGFDPIVLGEGDAQKSPIFAQYKAVAQAMPSVNPKGYDEACWVRWLAASCLPDRTVLMSDYDVFNYGWKFLPEEFDQARVNLFYHNVPCLAAASPLVFSKMCDQILFAEPTIDDQYQGRPNFEDQHWISREMRRGSSLFTSRLEVLEFGSARWAEAKLVHYCNNTMTGHQPRHLFIRKLRHW